MIGQFCSMIIPNESSLGQSQPLIIVKAKFERKEFTEM